MMANSGSTADLYGERHRNATLQLLKMFNESDPNANLIMSPYSIDRVLLTAYFGAANQTKQSLERLLCLDAVDKQAVANSFHLETKARVGREFASADKVYIGDHVDLKYINHFIIGNLHLFLQFIKNDFFFSMTAVYSRTYSTEK